MFKKALPIFRILAITVSSIALTTPAFAEGTPKANQEWWPKHLNLEPLRQNGINLSPVAKEFDYAAAFSTLDLKVLKTEIETLMTTSQDWWPADYGHYGPLFIRMAWHSAGTYRVSDGRGGGDGGQQRFEPLNSWPDNTNLDKARRLLWPLKQKYGNKISWADLMVLAGTVAMESMGFKTIGFAGGRTDDWQPELVYWGPETEFLADERYSGDRNLEKPLAAVQMGLIYVNPEGPNGMPDPLAAAKDIRETFSRMAMNDEETVALIAGGHTFGKTHGANKPSNCVGPEPAAAGIENQGLGWNNKCGTGKGADTITSGLEGAWTSSPTFWTTQFLDNLFNFHWVQTKSPGGATQWIPKEKDASELVLDAFDTDKRHAPIMLTTDLALKFDPEYRKIAKHFQENPEAFELAFAKAWFKLTHRDMGPQAGYVGENYPVEQMVWQDPIPTVDHKLVDEGNITELKSQIMESGLSISELVKTAWASAASFRSTDKRGGTNGARIDLEPQKKWAVNNPDQLSAILEILKGIQTSFNKTQSDNVRVSLADIIILGGAAAIEEAAKRAGQRIEVPFTPGRMDALQEQTDVSSFAVLEPTHDGFRNYLAGQHNRTPSQLLIERADLLDLNVAEMTVLVGGMRVLGANWVTSDFGVFTARPETLSNDFFINLLDLSTVWQTSDTAEYIYEGRDRDTGAVKWKATEVDLIFGSNSELRAVAEFYAYDDSQKAFINDFVAAWAKVMNLGRF